MNIKKLKIIQKKSLISSLPKQRKTIKALGLKKINDCVILLDTNEIRGMINVVNHMVKVEIYKDDIISK